jgi:cell shape-determining protein MreC
MQKDTNRPQCIERYNALLKKYQKELVRNATLENINEHLRAELDLWKTWKKGFEK